jgi:hypothetical protein
MSVTMSRSRTARPQKNSVYSPAVKNWLSRSEGIEALWPSLERQVAIQADVEFFCQQQRCGLFLVRELDNSELVLLAKSPSLAAKMRNLQTSLLQHLLQRGWYFTRIVVRVQAEQLAKQIAPRSSQIKKGLPENSLASWKKLGAELAPGALQEAVLDLLKRRSKHR